MEDDIIVIAHVAVKSGIIPVRSQDGLQFGEFIEPSLEKRERCDWIEWTERYPRSW